MDGKDSIENLEDNGTVLGLPALKPGFDALIAYTTAVSRWMSDETHLVGPGPLG